MKGIICTYSGTGNTRLACRYIAGHLQVPFDLVDVVVEHEVDLESYDIVGFATFTDFWGPPYLFQCFVEGLPQQAGKLAFVFNTYGAMSGKTLRVLERSVAARGFRVIAGHSLHTPENYPPMIARGMGAEGAPGEAEMAGFDAFISELGQLLERAQDGQEIEGQKVRIGWLNSILPNFARTKARKDMGDKYVDASLCTECGACEKQCPYGAIRLDPKPVFCSHQISRQSGIQERAATAVFHARLMPILADFVSDLKQLAVERAISAGLKIIRGDATAVGLEDAVARAAQTVASGPAATTYYGAMSAAAQTALIVDVGGTTTDISLVEQGRPVISADGSLIDRWLTHVDAVKMHTVGIGGDSLVKLGRSGKLAVGPGRVQSLAMSNGIPDPATWMGSENHCRYLVRPNSGKDHTESKDPVLSCLRDRGAAFGELKAQTGMSELSLDRRIEALVFKRQVVEIGFTPTDALNALGDLQIGDASLSTAAAKVLAKARNQEVGDFCREVLLLTQKKISDAIMSFLFAKEMGKKMAHFPFAEEKNALFSTSFKLHIPIVGIGAAASHLLPEVAKRLQTEIIFPPHYEVGNALGAIMIASKRG